MIQSIDYLKLVMVQILGIIFHMVVCKAYKEFKDHKVFKVILAHRE